MTDETKTNGYQKKIEAKEISIPVPWGHISGKWWGPADKQPMLAIHGWQDNAGTFDNLAPLISQNLPILCIDLPGHGLSSHYPPGQFYYLFWDGILVIRRIVKHFQFTQKLKLLGHSLGGAVSFLYAASYPDEVNSYICIDIASPAVRDSANFVSAIGDSVDRFFKFETMPRDKMPSYNRKEMLDIVVDAYAGSLSRESCEIMLKRGMSPALTAGTFKFNRDVRLKLGALGFLSLEQVLEFAARTTCKVLNIRADPGMKWTQPEHYDLVLDKIRESACYLERHVVAGTHHLHLNDAESIVEIIHKFLLLKL